MIAHHVSSAAYLSNQQIPGSVRFTRENTTAIVVDGPDAAYVAYAGTKPSSLADVFDDMRFDLVPFGSGKVHRGFLVHMLRLWPDIWRYISELNKPVIFTGHSLGAAASTLAASTMAGYFTHSVSLVTFGSPRVGNHKFALETQSVLKSVKRYVNNSDWFTMLPTMLRFSHVGKPLYFNRDEVLLNNPGFWHISWDRIKAAKVPWDGLSDHWIEEYVRLIEQNYWHPDVANGDLSR